MEANEAAAPKFDWARLVHDKAFILHIPTQTIGMVAHYWDGVATFYRTPGTGAEVKGPVVGLESGHSFVAAKEENFIILAPHEAAFYAGCQRVLAEGLKALVKLGAENEVMPATINVLIIGALRTQAMVLESGHRRAFGGGSPESMV